MTFLPAARQVSLSDQQSVLDVALNHGVNIAHSCGGMGSCTTCLVKVKSDLGQCAPRTDWEQEMAAMRNFREDERLSCQLLAHDGLVVEVPDYESE